MSAVLAVLTACTPEEVDLGTPNISIDKNEMVFEMAGGDSTLTVSATRDWMLEADADWVTVSPASGAGSLEPQTVTVTALENTGMDRSADLAFTIGMKRVVLTVSQAGPGGSPEALIVYANDFDKAAGVKGDKWTTYLDDATQTGWRNEKGTGIETVTYAAKSLTYRTNSGNGSAGKYSDYVELGASGVNYLWFGTAPTYFAVKNITLPEGKTDYTLSFGSEKYEYQAPDNTYKWDEFSVYVSADAKKWVKLAFDFAGGQCPNGRWDLATTDFTVPAGTNSLNVYFTSSVSSAYAIDDLKLVCSMKAGTAIDFASGEEFEVGGNISGGDDPVTPPSNIVDVTVLEFNEKEVSTSDWYRLTGVVSGPINTTYGNYDLVDETGKVYVYGTSNWSEYSASFAEGGIVTIVGQRGDYNGKIEVLESYIESYTPGEGGGNEGGDTPAEGQPTDLVEATIAEFLAAAESSDVWYELTGEIISIAKETYGNFTIKDETGEVYIYGMTSKWVGSNDQSFSQIGLKVGDIVTLGTLRSSYNGTPQGGGNPVPAFYISHVAGEGGNEGEEDPVTPPAGGEGQYESNITWTLGTNAYDNTSSGSNAQSAVVNGVTVNNLLKIGTGSKVGDATLHIPAGTTKLGFYCVAWKGKKAEVKFSVGGTEIATINPAANVGATGNAPYKELNVAESDYYEIEISATEATDVKVETLDPSYGRALFIGFKAE